MEDERKKKLMEDKQRKNKLMMDKQDGKDQMIEEDEEEEEMIDPPLSPSTNISPSTISPSPINNNNNNDDDDDMYHNEIIYPLIKIQSNIRRYLIQKNIKEIIQNFHLLSQKEKDQNEKDISSRNNNNQNEIIDQEIEIEEIQEMDKNKENENDEMINKRYDEKEIKNIIIIQSFIRMKLSMTKYLKFKQSINQFYQFKYEKLMNEKMENEKEKENEMKDDDKMINDEEMKQDNISSNTNIENSSSQSIKEDYKSNLLISSIKKRISCQIIFSFLSFLQQSQNNQNQNDKLMIKILSSSSNQIKTIKNNNSSSFILPSFPFHFICLKTSYQPSLHYHKKSHSQKSHSNLYSSLLNFHHQIIETEFEIQIIKIQSIFRMKCSIIYVKKMKQKRDEIIKSVIKIQSIIRSKILAKNYINHLKLKISSILIIHSFFNDLNKKSIFSKICLKLKFVLQTRQKLKILQNENSIIIQAEIRFLRDGW